MMKRTENDPWGDAAFEQAVRETAYFLWEQDGRPFGREQEYWYRALERTLRERNADTHLRQSPDKAEPGAPGPRFSPGADREYVAPKPVSGPAR
jgi:hypothetical protein